MKKFKIVLGGLLLSLALAGCRGTTSQQGTYFTVTFETGEGGTIIPDQSIRNGGKVTKPADPTRPGYLFDNAWLNGTFTWNFDVDIVTKDLTLVAKWLELSTKPSEIMTTAEPFSSKLTWRQTDAKLQDFEVAIKKNEPGASFSVLAGTTTVDDTNEVNVVTFTPEVIPQGGKYVAKITSGSEETISEELLLSGEGSLTNPYLVNEISDLVTVLDDKENKYNNKHYLQINDVLSTITNTLEITNDRKVVFGGTYDGGNYALSFTGNGGLFHEISADAVVKNLVIENTTQLYAAIDNLYPIGAVININNGLIDNVSSRAMLEDNHLQGALEVFTEVKKDDHSTGAGGIAGINSATGIIRNVTVAGAGAIKAGRGAGGVSAYNMGLIEKATVTATMPAGNQANTAKSSNTYSYGGGIAGFNFGTIQNVVVTGRVFAQSAYAAAGDGNEGKNVAFGGIAGYNEGLISKVSFARSMAAKEFISKSRATELGDVANNLGVASIHGDLYVGGIAGINAGEIASSYIGGALIGGRDFVGGVSGLTLAGSNIHHTYAFAEIAIKDDGGVKLTSANAKTSLTTYNVAPSGFDSATTFQKPLLNSDTAATWVPGDLAQPMLPVFSAADLAIVGTEFNESGTLKWQAGAVTSVDIALPNIVLPFGGTATLEYTVNPSNAPDQFTTWTSSNEAIVEIVGDGVIKGVGVGNATVTVTTRDGGFQDTIEVTVEDYVHVSEALITADHPLPKPNDSTDRPSIEVGTVITFNVEILPLDAQYKGYTITTSNSRAEANGNVVTIMPGATGVGNVSININFEDTTYPKQEYRFVTVNPVVPTEAVYEITSQSLIDLGYSLPVANGDSTTKVEITGTPVFTILVTVTSGTINTFTCASSTSRATAEYVYSDNVYTVTVTPNAANLGAFTITLTIDGNAFAYRFGTVAAV